MELYIVIHQTLLRKRNEPFVISGIFLNRIVQTDQLGVANEAVTSDPLVCRDAAGPSSRVSLLGFTLFC